MTGRLGAMSLVRKSKFTHGLAVFPDPRHLDVETAGGEKQSV